MTAHSAAPENTAAQHVISRRLGRIIGPGAFVAAAVTLSRAASIQELVWSLKAHPTALAVLGAFALVSGVTVVAVHRAWDSAVAALVSLFGWGLISAGALMLAIPHRYVIVESELVAIPGLWQGLALVMAAGGLYLTYQCWRRPR